MELGCKIACRQIRTNSIYWLEDEEKQLLTTGASAHKLMTYCYWYKTIMGSLLQQSELRAV